MTTADFTLGSILEARAASLPDQVIVRFEGETVTRRRLMTGSVHGLGAIAAGALALPALGFALGPVFERTKAPWQSVGAVGDFDDSALMFSFGQDGEGIFPAPSVIEAYVQRVVGVRLVGRAQQVKQRFYAISAEEHPKHPAVLAIRDAARQELFQHER